MLISTLRWNAVLLLLLPATTLFAAPTLNFEASLDTPGNNTWNTSVGPGGVNFTFAGARSPVAATPATAGIPLTYVFPSDTATAPTYQGFNGGAETQDASFEIWFNPSDLQGKHVLFETGGNGAGLNIELNGKTVQFNTQNNTSNQAFIGANLNENHVGKFNQVVGVLDQDSNLSLYLNGQLVGTTTVDAPITSWAGGNASGLGRRNDSVAGMDNTLNAARYSDFDGQLAIYRFYQNQVLTAAEVQAAFGAVSDGSEPAAQAAHTYKNLVLGYDAAAPGTGSNWLANFIPGTVAEQLTLSGGADVPTRVVGLAGPRTNITEAYEFVGGNGRAQFNDLLPNLTSNVTFEVWVKPNDLNGQEILFETGGDGNGASLLLDGNQLRFLVDEDGQQSAATVGTTSVQASATLSDTILDDFVQVVGTVDLLTDEIQLFVNGQLVDSQTAAEGLASWSGGNNAALGSANGTGTNIGASDSSNLNGFGTFDGLISIFRLYDTVLTQDQILANFAAQQQQVVPEPANMLIWSVVIGIGLVWRRRR